MGDGRSRRHVRCTLGAARAAVSAEFRVEAAAARSPSAGATTAAMTASLAEDAPVRGAAGAGVLGFGADAGTQAADPTASCAQPLAEGAGLPLAR